MEAIIVATNYPILFYFFISFVKLNHVVQFKPPLIELHLGFISLGFVERIEKRRV